MNKKVLCFGEVLWDTFPEGQKPGGAPMNVAMHLMKQGINASLGSRIGNDKEGERLKAFLQEHNLYSDLIQRDDKLLTCVVSVNFDADSQPEYTIPDPSAWDNIQQTSALSAAAETADIIVFGSLVCRHETSRKTLESILHSPAQKVFDVNIRAPHFDVKTIRHLGGMADIIKMNTDELNMLSGTELSHLSQKEKILFISDYIGIKTICITRGDSGAIIFLNGDFYEHPGFKVKVIDTVGAGDAFLATFIAGILKSEKQENILINACAMGAFVAGSRGANPDYDLKNIGEIIKQPV